MLKKRVRRVSSVKKNNFNNTKQKEVFSYKKLIIPLLTIAVIIVMAIFLIPMKKEAPVVGKAISQNLGSPNTIQIQTIGDGELLMNPASAQAAMQYNSISQTWDVGETITVEVAGNPSTSSIPAPNPKFNNYEFVVTYDSAYLIFSSVKNLVVGNWVITSTPMNSNSVKVTATGKDVNTDVFGTNPLTFVELTFKTKAAIATDTLITLFAFKNINAYGNGGSSASIISTHKNLNLKIGHRMFEDADKDGYGSVDLAKSIISLLQPASAPSGYSFIEGDCDDAKSSVHPLATEVCDGIDNNCVAGTTDETKPTCNDLTFECGIHSECMDSFYLNCNKQDQNGKYLTDELTCQSKGKDVCNKGTCASLQGQQLQQLQVADVFTPACGDTICDSYENTLTCPKDCTACPPAVSDGCKGTDTDKDGLSDAYEDYLQSQLVSTVGPAPTSVSSWYDKSNADSDYDEVPDGQDFCPGTDNPLYGLVRAYLVSNGRINFNGCYTGDVGTQDKGVRPDGCFNLKDTTFSIDYYAGTVTCNSFIKK